MRLSITDSGNDDISHFASSAVAHRRDVAHHVDHPVAGGGPRHGLRHLRRSVVVIWRSMPRLTVSDPRLRIGFISAALVPSYMLFALCLMVVSPIATRLLRLGHTHRCGDADQRHGVATPSLDSICRIASGGPPDCGVAGSRHAAVDGAPASVLRAAWEARVRQQPVRERLQPPRMRRRCGDRRPELRAKAHEARGRHRVCGSSCGPSFTKPGHGW